MQNMFHLYYTINIFKFVPFENEFKQKQKKTN